MSLDLFLILFTLSYIVLMVIFIVGLLKPRDVRSNVKPFVSVIIAARNEERSLPRCLDSLLQQSYQKDLYEIIIVNDFSSDATEEICKQYSLVNTNVRYVNATESAKSKGKANALACGIDVARGEVILITDADCVVPPRWIEETAARYEPEVGLVGGITLPISTNWFTGMQTLDWAFILGMAASTASLGFLHGSVGNNLSFRKKAYDEVGGYHSLKFSVTEDYTIVQAISKTKKWKYYFPVNKEMLVLTEPCFDVRTLISQKHRWGKGGLDMKLTGFVIFVIGFLMHLSPLILIYQGNIVFASTIFLFKCIVDYIFLYILLKKLDKTNELQWFYYFEVYFLLYVLVLPFLVFFGGSVRWKDRTF